MSDRISNLKLPPDPHLVDELEARIRVVVSKLDERKNCDDLIAEINTIAGGQAYTEQDLFELYGWTSEREFAELAAKGPPPQLDGLTREELLDAVGTVATPEEPNSSFFNFMLERSLPHSWDADLVFGAPRELTDAEIVDEVLLREQLAATGGRAAAEARREEFATWTGARNAT